MTENKRYSNDSLAKWYYCRNYNGMRVISNGVDEFALNSKKQFKDINGKELNGTNQLIDELNKLEDKIIILEKEYMELIKKECYGNLDGLETYKALYSHLSEKYDNLEADFDDLRKENEQLKAVVKEVIGLLIEEVDVFSDKATEHDLNAYRELQQLDNKDAYYIATATKKAIKLLKGIIE